MRGAVRFASPKTVAVLLAVASLAVAFDTRAQDAGRQYRVPANLLRYFQDKYIHVDEGLTSTVQQTPDGPLGQINVRGRLLLPGPAEGATPDAHARETARAFIREEAALLGIADLAELREASFQRHQGEARIDFVRMIGKFELLDTRIHVRVGAQGEITRVHATLRPVSDALREAVRKPTLARENIAQLVMRDLGSTDGAEVRFTTDPAAFARWRAPYVVWTATAARGDKPAWSYTLDAFTGEILAKACTARTIVNVTGATPCD